MRAFSTLEAFLAHCYPPLAPDNVLGSVVFSSQKDNSGHISVCDVVSLQRSAVFTQQYSVRDRGGLSICFVLA